MVQFILYVLYIEYIKHICTVYISAPELVLSLIVSAFSRIEHTLLWANVTLTAYVNNLFTFLKSAYYILVVFHQFFTWIALGDVDLCFSLILITKVNAFEGGTMSALWLYHQLTQSIYMTDGITVMSLSASLQHKAILATDYIYHITINRKLSHKFEK